MVQIYFKSNVSVLKVLIAEDVTYLKLAVKKIIVQFFKWTSLRELLIHKGV